MGKRTGSGMGHSGIPGGLLHTKLGLAILEF